MTEVVEAGFRRSEYSSTIVFGKLGLERLCGLPYALFVAYCVG